MCSRSILSAATELKEERRSVLKLELLKEGIEAQDTTGTF